MSKSKPDKPASVIRKSRITETCKQSLQVPTIAKSATVEPMVYKRALYGTPRGEPLAYSYTIYERDLPRIVEAFADLILVNYNGEDGSVNRAKALLRTVGIDTK